ncbi:hypothetical protein NORO109296_24865 [Nocardiopsis rhodophaea]
MASSGDDDLGITHGPEVVSSVEDHRLDALVTQELRDSLTDESLTAHYRSQGLVLHKRFRYSDNAVCCRTGTVRRSTSQQCVDVLLAGNPLNRHTQIIMGWHLNDDSSRHFIHIETMNEPGKIERMNRPSKDFLMNLKPQR